MERAMLQLVVWFWVLGRMSVVITVVVESKSEIANV